ncbi:MAG: hypothetical protein M3Y56_01750 [Armatimonadota bacterium]|nr:hypothetical protein [Armatimonadota bacterium]
MKFIVLSRRQVSSFTSEEPYIVISITDPDRSTAHVAEHPTCLGLLRLQFNDIHSPKGSRVLFSNEMADEILRFVTSHSEAETVVCQCEAGISRSAGVAAALAKVHGGDPAPYFEQYLPNRFVYSKLLERKKIKER